MMPPAVYDAALAIVQAAAITFTDDMGATSPISIVESDTVPAELPNAGGALAWSMFPTDSVPLENPRTAPWRVRGYVQVHVMVPANLGPRGRIGVVNAVSDAYRAATPNGLFVIYGAQNATVPTNDDAGVYSVVTMQIAWECDEPMPATYGATQ